MPVIRNQLFRPHSGPDHHRVTYAELFFDLVFVFAVTQLAHRLSHAHGAIGVLETFLLMLAVWWVWMYTTWVTNWLNPDKPPVRLMLFALMLGGLAISTSIPEAFDEHALVFAAAYASMQVGRSLFMLWAIPRHDAGARKNFVRILSYLTASGVLWIVGGLCEHPDARLFWWFAALGIEYLGPSVRYWLPGLGASSLSDWDIDGGHISERCAQFILIGLGESVLDAGATFAESNWSQAAIVSVAVAFIGSLAMWWIYFDTAVESGSEKISQAKDPGRLARLAYTYLHLPIILGIIVTAVGNEMLLGEPHEACELPVIGALLGGPAAYLVGVVLFKRAVRGWFQLSHLAGIVAFLIAAPFAHALPRVVVASIATGILLTVAVWESISLKSRELIHSGTEKENEI